MRRILNMTANMNLISLLNILSQIAYSFHYAAVWVDKDIRIQKFDMNNDYSSAIKNLYFTTEECFFR